MERHLFPVDQDEGITLGLVPVPYHNMPIPLSSVKIMDGMMAVGQTT